MEMIPGMNCLQALKRCPNLLSLKSKFPPGGTPVAGCSLFDIGGNSRHASSWKKKAMEQHKREDVVFQYAGDKAKQTKQIYVWGYAATGALGVQEFLRPSEGKRPRKHQLNPFRLSFWETNNLEVNTLACGYGFTVFACKDETNQGNHVLYGTGINTDSQLGYQEYPRNSGRILDYIIEPVKIDLPLNDPDKTKILSVSCGRAHTFVLTDNEGVFSLGNNAYGQCGREVVEGEIYKGSKIINKVKIDASIKDIKCGQDHTIFLTDEGKLYSCGLGGDGQTGQGHFELVGVPEKVKGDVESENIVQVSCMVDTVLCVSDKGEVFGFGNSEYRQFGSVEESTQLPVSKKLPFNKVGKVKKVAAAGSTCALLNDQGQVYVWGYGILGKGPVAEEFREPTRIPPAVFGQTDFNASVEVEDITCSISYFAAITSTNDLYMWGRNNQASLGLGHTNDQFFPFKVHVPAEVEKIFCGVDHTVAMCHSFA